MRRALATLTVLVGVVAVTTACDGGKGAGTGSTETKKIAITIAGDSVTPNGDRVDVSVDQPIELDVTADAAGVLHAHTGGAGQEFAYQAGQNTFTFTIAAPGVVPVETHPLDKTIVQLYAQ